MGFSKGKFGSSAARTNWRLLRVMLALWVIIVACGVALHLGLDTPWWLTPQLYLVGLVSFHDSSGARSFCSIRSTSIRSQA